MSAVAGLGYAAACAVLCLFQIALVAGAPWGAFTQGGLASGRLDARGRAVAAVSIPVLVFMAGAVLSASGAAGADWPRWTAWAALGLTGLTTIANWATPSRRERALWGPVTLLMLALAVVAVWG